jgi:hypothetical protein
MKGKTKNTTLSEQFNNLIEKQKNTTLSEQFQNQTKYSLKEAKSIHPTKHIHDLSLVQALQ